jgi:hypothetical protein
MKESLIFWFKEFCFDKTSGPVLDWVPQVLRPPIPGSLRKHSYTSFASKTRCDSTYIAQNLFIYLFSQTKGAFTLGVRDSSVEAPNTMLVI